MLCQAVLLFRLTGGRPRTQHALHLHSPACHEALGRNSVPYSGVSALMRVSCCVYVDVCLILIRVSQEKGNKNEEKRKKKSSPSILFP